MPPPQGGREGGQEEEEEEHGTQWEKSRVGKGKKGRDVTEEVCCVQGFAAEKPS